ncbi:MAG: signal peptidase I, partial [Chitinispirillaceae bacterium]|nr:signal peptidase I [Chitinispirillaceae bacterium]
MSPKDRRSEKAGIFRFVREMGSALAMALVFIVYVIQAFKIPTGSMEDSLLVGDFLLGLKFVYGAPVLPYSYKKFPAVTSPKPGDVIIFRYPGADKKDYIKRCVAGPGQTVEVRGKTLLVDDREFVLPPHGKFVRDGELGGRISEFSRLRIPEKGDVLVPSALPLRECLFSKNLIHQENPHDSVRIEFQLYIDSVFSNGQAIPLTDPYSGRDYNITFSDLRLNSDDWTYVDRVLGEVEKSFPGRFVEIRRLVLLNNK